MFIEKAFLLLPTGLAGLFLAQFDPAAHREWTLSAFAVALVIYLLWKSERVDRQTAKWRDDHLKATLQMSNEISALRNELRSIDSSRGESQAGH